MHAVIHRSIVTFYLCWNLVNSHPPVFTNKATEMEINTPDGPEYSYNDLMNWAYFFEMVKIQNCGDLLKSADDTFPHQVKKLLMEREWSPKLVDDLVKKYNQSNWPPGISDEEICNDEKERRIKNYNCRRIPGFLKGNREEAVIVLAIDNVHMPADTIAEPGFLMFLNQGALYYTNDDKLRGLEKCFDIVEVLRWDLLITSPDNSFMESAHHQLTRQNWLPRNVYSIIGKYSQNNWPSGISGTQLHDGEKMSLLKNYICRRIPSVLSGNQEEAVIVFASDNMHMPADMIAHPGFLMAFKQGALYSLGYDEFKSVPDTLESVQISRWGLLLTSPDNYLWDRVNSLLFKRKIPYRLTRAILERYSKTNWPLGTLSALLQYDEEKKMLLNKYVCRRIPGVLSDNQEEAVIVFASDNTHMPLDMIVEPGFLMMFNPAINMEIDRPHFSDYSIHDLMKWVYYFEKVKIQNCGYLLTSADDSFTHQVKNVLIKRMWSTQLVDELVEKYNLSTWPSGISSEEICNDEKERRIKNYNCRRIPGFLKGNREEAVIVLAIDNPHMPADTITKPGFMMFLNPGAMYYSNDDEFECAENCFDIVEVLRWDLLITSPDNSLMVIL
ncbi:uncharacterized protein LOC126837492 [Adelges cooleyi]|uniref:uncharacterized protein LOC126837492 n=1 Tax=Adelges cooleyi TaxID=133065 RepID=UPI00217FCF4B|nr:uncharacterized protein LOC126837492 [Adelges cooleyi]